jgi:predicted nucleic acid-binding protein
MSRRPSAGSEKDASMLIDTEVLIWVLRGSAKAARLIDSITDRRISVVTFMELLQGARDKRESRLIKSFLADFGFRTIPLGENIGHRAAIYIEEYGLGSGLRTADALIAATAAEHGLALCTGDRTHYRAIRDLTIQPFRP